MSCPGAATVVSADLVQYPDTAIGRRFKTEWLRMQAREAAAIGASHVILPRSGHRIQADATAEVLGALRIVIARASSSPPR